MKKNTIKWLPALPARRPDCLVSSKARENNESGFIPSYEKEPRENMKFIMSFEYLRIWLKERNRYEIDTYSKVQVDAGGDIKRRYVQRYVRSHKPPVRVLQPIKLKRFANVSAKTESKPPTKHEAAATNI